MQEHGLVTALFVRIAQDRQRLIRDATHRSIKRLGDIAGALAILIVIAPILIIVAALVAIDVGLPIVYAHPRVGRGGRRFRCLKYRTMHTDADERLALLLASDADIAAQWRRSRKLDRDPRISSLGTILRKTSLDELPQLLNVLRGDMSLVGPRPVTASELSRYGANVHYYLRVTPGITGLWQVSGRSEISYLERVCLDARYAREWTILGDLKILWLTPQAVLLRKGAQ